MEVLLFSMISVPCETDDIAVAMISAPQMIYASRMMERISSHICNANISYGFAVYHITRYIIESPVSVETGDSCFTQMRGTGR